METTLSVACSCHIFHSLFLSCRNAYFKGTNYTFFTWIAKFAALENLEVLSLSFCYFNITFEIQGNQFVILNPSCQYIITLDSYTNLPFATLQVDPNRMTLPGFEIWNMACFFYWTKEKCNGVLILLTNA